MCVSSLSPQIVCDWSFFNCVAMVMALVQQSKTSSKGYLKSKSTS